MFLLQQFADVLRYGLGDQVKATLCVDPAVARKTVFHPALRGWIAAFSCRVASIFGCEATRPAVKEVTIVIDHWIALLVPHKIPNESRGAQVRVRIHLRNVLGGWILLGSKCQPLPCLIRHDPRNESNVVMRLSLFTQSSVQRVGLGRHRPIFKNKLWQNYTPNWGPEISSTHQWGREPRFAMDGTVIVTLRRESDANHNSWLGLLNMNKLCLPSVPHPLHNEIEIAPRARW
mmetsp:Transcript_34952/g.93278  ORF Transcript_34952/g.93278 Transcript_34952/m.93278 type:complete len:232 (+) Transcript_34952:257-952(+)